MVERYTEMLAGYLLALQRLSNSGSKFTANCFLIEHDIDASIQKQISQWGVAANYVGKTKLSYEEVKCFLNQNYYADLSTATKDQIFLFDWDIQEFFGLMATEISPKGNFHPLISKGGYNLNIECNFYREMHALLVEIENLGVILVASKNA